MSNFSGNLFFSLPLFGAEFFSILFWGGRELHPCRLPKVIRRNAEQVGGDLRREEFQIVGDRTWEKRVYPASNVDGDIVRK